MGGEKAAKAPGKEGTRNLGERESESLGREETFCRTKGISGERPRGMRCEEHQDPAGHGLVVKGA